MNFKKTIVVVEIGNDWIKIAENTVSPKGGCITQLRFIKLADIKEPVGEAISKIFKELKLKKHSVITYIPRHLVNVRVLEVPSTNPKEISDMVNLQVGKQTPYSKEEIVSSHRIVDTPREGYTKVMLVIAKRNIISERIDTISKAGCEVEKVLLSSEGVYNWFRTAYTSLGAKIDESKSIILIDIDSNYSDFIVICKGKLVFTRNIFVGANHLLEGEPEWHDKFVNELKRSMERYQSEEKDVNIERIFLSGAAKNIKDLDSSLSAGLEIPAEIFKPIRDVNIKKDITVLQDDNIRFISTSSLFGIAINYKKSEIDLTPGEIRIQKLMEEKRKNLTVMGVLLASIAMMASLLLLTDIYNKNMYLAQLKDKISKVEEGAKEVAKMRIRINLIEERLDPKGSSLDIVNEIYRLTPDEIYFTNISVEDKSEAILRGCALAMSDVFTFVTTLEESRYFENVKTTYTTTRKKEGKEYADFEIICLYEK